MSRSAETKGEILVPAPHPDDDVIGPGATLLELQRRGYHIVSLAVSLGRPEQHDRRRAELEDATDRAGFELVIPDEPASISGGDDMDVARAHVTAMVSDEIKKRRPVAIVSPGIHDAHHGHEVVAEAVRASLIETTPKGESARWWMYKTWGHIVVPNIIAPFDEAALAQVNHVLAAHAGENARNDYEAMVANSTAANVEWGSERVFPFGSPTATDLPYAELFSEFVYKDGVWAVDKGRVLDFDNPFPIPSADAKDQHEIVMIPSPYAISRSAPRVPSDLF